jgi:hypothetical protein
VFGYIKLSKVSYLVLIEEATIIGQILNGIVYRVEKLMYIPLINNSSLKIDADDEAYVAMIEKI